VNPIIFIILAILGVGAAGLALVPGVLGPNRAAKRIKAFQGDMVANRREASASRAREDRRKNIQSTLKKESALVGPKKKNVPLQDQIYQAGMKTTKRDFIRNQIIVGAVIFAITFFLQVPILFGFVFAVAGGYLGPKFWLSRARKKYQNKYLEELPNAVEAIVRGVKSGLPLNDSMRLVAKEAKEPIKSEFQRVIDQQAVGKTMPEAVGTLYDRMPVPEVNFFIVVITVQQQAGGNLSEALGNLSRVLRNRKKMKQKIKAMSSEAKASAGIIGALPFLVGLLVSLTTPGYLMPLIETPIGNIWLGVAVVMFATGIFIMNKMIQFDF
jgi:tight adherence protein B